MKEQITKCYNITVDLLNNEFNNSALDKKLNEMYELLTEVILEMEK